MPVRSVDELVVGHITEADYYSGKGQLLIAKGEALTEQHFDLLRRRNIYEIHFHLEDRQDSAPKESPSPAPATKPGLPAELSTVLDRLRQARWEPGQSAEMDEQLLSGHVIDSLDRAMKLERINDNPVGKAFKTAMHQQYLMHRPSAYKSGIVQVYTDSIESIKGILTRLTSGSQIDTGSIRSLVERFIPPLLNDRNIILSIASQKVDRVDPLYNHVLNVILLSMNLAAVSNFGEEQVVQIGMGALLHDVGMLLVPKEIRFKQGRLSEEEWYEIRKHPLFGLHIIDHMVRLPDSVKYITYQTHERENGRGYPKQRAGRLIHNYAKIVQIADIFDAVSSPRPYRVAYTPYKGVEMLIKMGKQKLVNETYVNAMLKSISLFPVGSMVELSDGRIAQVIAANEYHLGRPLLSVVAERGGSIISSSNTYTLDLSLEHELQVVRSLPFDSMGCDVLYGF